MSRAFCPGVYVQEAWAVEPVRRTRTAVPMRYTCSTGEGVQCPGGKCHSFAFIQCHSQVLSHRYDRCALQVLQVCLTGATVPHGYCRCASWVDFISYHFGPN